MTQAEEMRQQRNNEAKQLIGSRVGTAKAIFTQNSASGQMLTSKTAAPIKPVRNSIAQRINSLNNQSASDDGNTKIEDEEFEDQPQKSISPIAEVEPTNITVSPTVEQMPANNENKLTNSEIISDTNGKKTMHGVQTVKFCLTHETDLYNFFKILENSYKPNNTKTMAVTNILQLNDRPTQRQIVIIVR